MWMKVKYVNAKIFNIISRVNEARSIVQHISCECKSGMHEIVRNWKQKWNPDECWCECKEIDD